MHRRVDAIVSVSALVGVSLWFVWLNVPAIRYGLTTTDDASFAMAAKALATGHGYGTPRSNEEFVAFDPHITTGPTLIVPMALLLRIFGSVEWLPGAAALVIFAGELVIVALVLSRAFGWAPACGFLFTTMLLVMLVSVRQWTFGRFYGEPPAFGLLLIGMALLATRQGTATVVAAALCFGAAYLTKQISVMAVIGIVAAWVVIVARRGSTPTYCIGRIAMLGLIALSLPVAFELVKVGQLGWDGYREWSLGALEYTKRQAMALPKAYTLQGAIHRLGRFTARLSEYAHPVPAIVGTFGLLCLWTRGILKRDRGQPAARRLAALSWAGAAVYLAYILAISILWARYFWIGVAVACAALAAPILILDSRARAAVIAVLAAATVLFGLHRPLEAKRDRMVARNSVMQQERAAVLRVLDDHRTLPFAADHWASLAAVLYLKDDAGVWASGPWVDRWRDRPFIAIIHHEFTDPDSPFTTLVTAYCRPLTPGASIHSAHQCGARFWDAYTP